MANPKEIKKGSAKTTTLWIGFGVPIILFTLGMIYNYLVDSLSDENRTLHLQLHEARETIAELKEGGTQLSLLESQLSKCTSDNGELASELESVVSRNMEMQNELQSHRVTLSQCNNKLLGQLNAGKQQISKSKAEVDFASKINSSRRDSNVVRKESRKTISFRAKPKTKGHFTLKPISCSDGEAFITCDIKVVMNLDDPYIFASDAQIGFTNGKRKQTHHNLIDLAGMGKGSQAVKRGDTLSLQLKFPPEADVSSINLLSIVMHNQNNAFPIEFRDF